jgi:nicotinamide-nucleotide amidase
MSFLRLPRRVARLLKEAECKVVFAESCTGGAISGALAGVAGISAYLCGGVVVYRNETKMAYLDISAELLRKPGAVSEKVAKLMAQRVLKMTPEADVAVSVTGHLGPMAPPSLDGHVYAAIAWRRRVGRKLVPPSVRFFECRRTDPRITRQWWVVEQVLNLLAEELEDRAA